MWYSRDILKYKTLDEARANPVNTIDAVEKAFTQMGLIPHYRSYVDMISEMKKEWPATGSGDPYIEGTWLAGQLWLLNNDIGSNKVFRAILNIALTGKKFEDPLTFLNEVKNSL